MTTANPEKQELLEKLNLILKRQSQVQQDINELQQQIVRLQTHEEKVTIITDAEKVVNENKKTIMTDKREFQKTPIQPTIIETIEVKIRSLSSGVGNEIEKFIGENLISKIGIAVLIIGVGIGTKYAIDNNLISPLVRIILGYLVGFSLNFFAYRSKKKYFNFSAVLASGAMAIHYFITYAAFIYYNLIPQPVTFGIMVLMTILTVALALYYNRQVISHFGLVGAYIVPFLLKDPDSSVVVLLVYMTIVNCGILYISTRKNWKPLNYLALVSTWLIFMTWFFSKENNDQLGLALTFASIFFILFYLVFLSYKLILKEKLHVDDIIFLVLNSGMFFVVGIIALNMSNLEEKFAGIFTFINAIVHALTAFLIFRFEKEDKKLFYWTISLVVLFFTISIPIQFNNYITVILWTLTAFALFWFGISKRIKFFESVSYILVSLVFFTAVSNWAEMRYNFWMDEAITMIKPFINFTFISSLGLIAGFSSVVHFQLKMPVSEKQLTGVRSVYSVIIPVLLILSIYFTFFNETNLYWNNVQIKTCYEQNIDGNWVKQLGQLNNDVFLFKSLWLINYSLLFVSVLAFVNFKWFKNLYLSAICLIFSSLFSIVFLADGLSTFANLRESYLNPANNPDFNAGILHLIIRYISFLFFSVMLYSLYKFVIPFFKAPAFKAIFEVTLSLVLVIVFSSELVNILKITGSEEVYKHGLSILWGLFSFMLIGYGIWRKNKYLRITAISLFGVTLIKLFIYDLSNLSTIQKTIVFVLVGILLLVVSFMYNKYRNLIFGNNS